MQVSMSESDRVIQFGAEQLQSCMKKVADCRNVCGV